MTPANSPRMKPSQKLDLSSASADDVVLGVEAAVITAGAGGTPGSMRVATGSPASAVNEGVGTGVEEIEGEGMESGETDTGDAGNAVDTGVETVDGVGIVGTGDAVEVVEAMDTVLKALVIARARASSPSW